jgi:sterol desaturase/sphingolipid hydroxylase (fatty acid hydroxylase superfamily)
MENTLIQFFSPDKQPIHLTLIVLTFIICWNLESIIGITTDYKRYKHFANNFLFTLPGALIQGLVGIGFIKLLLFLNFKKMGFIHFLGIKSILAEIIVTFVFLDFTYWLYHFLMHKIEFLWKFHAVHHSDHVLNVSTSLREHPVETVIRLSHYVIAVSFLGTSLWIITMHQFIQVVSKIIIHGNFRLSEKVDKVLSYFILTPNMHHAHHHYMQPNTDSNYGDLFSLWDRVFGTYTHMLKEDVKFGLDVEEFTDHTSKNMKFVGLVKIPFSGKKLSN